MAEAMRDAFARTFALDLIDSDLTDSEWASVERIRQTVYNQSEWTARH